jgi:hypothetical protein
MHGLKRAEAVENSAPPLLDCPSVQSWFAAGIDLTREFVCFGEKWVHNAESILEQK